MYLGSGLISDTSFRDLARKPSETSPVRGPFDRTSVSGLLHTYYVEGWSISFIRQVVLPLRSLQKLVPVRVFPVYHLSYDVSIAL